MESHISAALDQILKRLDKMEGHHCQLDRVMERLDTVHNSLESLNQKQNLLEKTIKEKQDKAREEAVIHTGNRTEATASLHLTTQSLPSWAQQIVDKLNMIDDRTTGTAQQCHQLVGWSQKVTVVLNKCTENDKENMKTFLAEVGSVKNLVKGQTNAELIWLNKQINEKVSHNDSVLSEILQQQNGMSQQIVRSTAQVVETVIKQGEVLKGMFDNQKQTILDLEANTIQISSSVLDVSREIHSSLETFLAEGNKFMLTLENKFGMLVAEQSEDKLCRPMPNCEFFKTELTTFITQVKSALERQTSIFMENLERKTETVTVEIKAQQGTVTSQLQALISQLQTLTGRVMGDAKMTKEYLRDLIKAEGDNTRKLGDTIQALISTQANNSNALIVKSVGQTVGTLMKKEHTKVTDILKQHTTVTMGTIINNLTIKVTDSFSQNITDSIDTRMKKEYTQLTESLKQHTADIISTIMKEEHTQKPEILKQNICTADTISALVKKEHTKVTDILKQHTADTVGTLKKEVHTKLTDSLKQHTADINATLRKQVQIEASESLMKQMHTKVSESLSQQTSDIVTSLILSYVLFSFLSFLYHRFF